MLPLKTRPNIAESLCTRVFSETMLGLDLFSRITFSPTLSSSGHTVTTVTGDRLGMSKP